MLLCALPVSMSSYSKKLAALKIPLCVLRSAIAQSVRAVSPRSRAEGMRRYSSKLAIKKMYRSVLLSQMQLVGIDVMIRSRSLEPRSKIIHSCVTEYVMSRKKSSVVSSFNLLSMFASLVRCLTLLCTLLFVSSVSADFFTDSGASDIMPVR